MKKYIIIIILLTSTVVEAVSKDWGFFKPKPKEFKHEISIGYGIIPLVPSLFLGGIRIDGCCGMPNPYFSNNNYISSQYNVGPEYFSPGAVNIGYMYNLKKWLSVGATFSHHGNYQKTYNRIDGSLEGKENYQSFSLTGMVRFNYLNKEWVRLYGQVGLGLGVFNEVNYLGNNDYSETMIYPTGQFTFFGIQVGKAFYGFCEVVGAGTNGLCVIGIGYKF